MCCRKGGSRPGGRKENFSVFLWPGRLLNIDKAGRVASPWFIVCVIKCPKSFQNARLWLNGNQRQLIQLSFALLCLPLCGRPTSLFSLYRLLIYLFIVNLSFLLIPSNLISMPTRSPIKFPFLNTTIYELLAAFLWQSPLFTISSSSRLSRLNQATCPWLSRSIYMSSAMHPTTCLETVFAGKLYF